MLHDENAARRQFVFGFGRWVRIGWIMVILILALGIAIHVAIDIRNLRNGTTPKTGAWGTDVPQVVRP